MWAETNSEKDKSDRTMTREEAIKIIDCYDIGFYDLSGEKIPADKLAEAFDMAIEALSADAVQGEWIPCGEKMPKELERVNVTWLNHNPPFYYQHIKDIPQTDTAVYYRGKWYWWDATVIDVLAEYGEDCNAEQIDKDIEVIAWMPLPKPYKGGDTE